MHILRQSLRKRASRTNRAQSQSQRLAEEPLRLRLLVALRERTCEVTSRSQRPLVLCTEEAGLLDENLALDLRGLGVLVLP